MTPPRPQYLTEVEAASMLGLRRGTLSNWRSQRKGPAYHRIGGTKDEPGRAIRYEVSELREWAEQYRVEPEAAAR